MENYVDLKRELVDAAYLLSHSERVDVFNLNYKVDPGTGDVRVHIFNKKNERNQKNLEFTRKDLYSEAEIISHHHDYIDEIKKSAIEILEGEGLKSV